MNRPIAISLSPNTEHSDVLAAWKQLISPQSYLKGESTSKLEKWFCSFFDVPHAVSFASGRGALYAALKALGVEKNDEVILQAFTCVAVPNAVIWAGAIPIYCDIDESFTINPQELEKKITKRTKAIIVQHTFGIPSNMEKIMALAKKNNIFVIEDCAHEVGVEYNNKKLGTFGDIAIFSFGRDKAFSSVFGGMAITNNSELSKNIKTYQESLSYPTKKWVFQQLFHPVAFSLILPLYNYSIGKILLVLFQKLGLLSFPVSQKEKESILDETGLKKMPNGLTVLSLVQLGKLDRYNKKREEISKLYKETLSTKFIFLKTPLAFLRFPVLYSNRDGLISYLREKGIYVGKWYSEVIDPKGVDFKKCYYTKGTCEVAEESSRTIINLPTYPTMEIKDAQKIIYLLNEYANR